jgi:Ca2+-binding EF-hand superfamily protein
MKARIVSMTAVMALFALTGSVWADDTDGSSAPSNQRLQRLMARFHKADVNGDGQLTREEARQGMRRVYQHFAEIDTDNKGYVTLAQVASYAEAHPEQGGRSRNGGSPPPSSAPTQ